MARLGVAWAALLTVLLAGTIGCGSTSFERGDRTLRSRSRTEFREVRLSSEDERRVEAHARFTAGILAELEGHLEEALEHFQAAVASDPLNEDLTFDVVRKLIERRRYEDARLILERFVRRSPQPGMAWGWLGIVHSLQGNPKAAIAANREAIARMPRNIGAYQNLVVVYLQAGQAADALAVLEEAGRQPDTDSGFLLVLANSLGVLDAMRHPDLGNLQPRIVALLDRAAELGPRNAAERLRLADLYHRFGESAKSLPLYQALLESDPDLPGLRERLTGIYLESDNPDKAIEQLEILSRIEPTNPLPHYFLGVLALERQRFEEAVDAFNRVLLLRPDQPDIYFDLAIAHLRHRRPAEALAILDRARLRFRPSFRLEYFSGTACIELERYDQAIRHLTAAEVIAGATAPEHLTPAFFFQSGVAFERAKRYEDAAAQFERAIELDPNFAEALNYLGYMWAEQGLHLERAHELIERAVRLDPDNDAYLDSLAWVLHQLGRSEEALPHQLRAVSLSEEPDPTLYDHLGDIYHRLGRLEDARAAWQRALDLKPDPEIERKLEDSGP
ncbi:MAG: tetratricopeptide repeat protein [Verrucomicrobiae bacterium]|nr:tetratricopeptide repeat protein [Verrucomicrobiae bacterium]